MLKQDEWNENTASKLEEKQMDISAIFLKMQNGQ